MPTSTIAAGALGWENAPADRAESAAGDRLLGARIMAVDDQEANLRLLSRVLSRAGFHNFRSTQEPRDALALFAEFKPDLILLDLHMPNLNGFDVLEQLRGVINERTYLPVCVISADLTADARQQALSRGAKDFLNKPFDLNEVTLRIRNLLETRFLHLEIQRQNEALEDKVRERTRQLDEAHMEVLERLACAAEYRDDETGQHTQRVGEGSARLAGELGVPTAECQMIGRAATLHDVGKIGIPDAILLKRAQLTPQEFEVMKTHTTIGARILSGGRSDLLRLAESIATGHHERWDGHGYPAGFAGDTIPLAARIVSVVDFHDALSHDRPYRPAWDPAKIRSEIELEVGNKFDPRVATAFLGMI